MKWKFSKQFLLISQQRWTLHFLENILPFHPGNLHTPLLSCFDGMWHIPSHLMLSTGISAEAFLFFIYFSNLCRTLSPDGPLFFIASFPLFIKEFASCSLKSHCDILLWCSTSVAFHLSITICNSLTAKSNRWIVNQLCSNTFCAKIHMIVPNLSSNSSLLEFIGLKKFLCDGYELMC